jgi:hypothetical protein
LKNFSGDTAFMPVPHHLFSAFINTIQKLYSLFMHFLQYKRHANFFAKKTSCLIN